MVKSGDYLTPSAFGELAIWAGKPPLLMWLMSLSYQVFGVNNFAARLWIPVFATLSFVLVYFLGKKFYNRQVGVLSAIVLGTFTTFFAFARHAMTDVPLIFFMLASMYFLLLSENTKNTYRYAALSGLFFGLALMTKQISALLIPLIVIIYLAATKRSLRFLITKRFAVFLGVALLILAPWLVYMNFRFGFNFWNCYFMYAVFTRTVSPIEGHVGGFLYYFNYMATSENLVWVILLPFAVGLCAYNAVIKRLKGDALILTWMATVLIVFTIAQTKIYYYILPAYPAFAIAISSFLYQLSKKIPLFAQSKKAAKKVEDSSA
jgi:4-amino-4-deoxy-L-arabinose transferase-like glycosyltransferase